MDNSGANVTDTLSSSTKSFFASFGSNLGNAGGGLSGLFQSLLAESQTIQTGLSQKPTATPTSTGSTFSLNSLTQNSVNTGNIPQELKQTVRDIVSSLRDFNNKWSNHLDQSVGGHSSDGQDQQKTVTSNDHCNGNDTSTTTQASTSTTTSDSTQTPSVSSTSTCSVTDQNNSTSGVQTTSSSSDNNSATAPSIADLIAQLQAIMALLQNAQTVAPTTGNDPTNGNNQTANNDPANNDPNAAAIDPSIQALLNAGNALGDLLTLMQKLEASAGLTPSADPTQGNSTDPTNTVLTTIDNQLRNDLQNLLNALNTEATQATTTATNTSATTTSADATQTSVTPSLIGTDPTLQTGQTSPLTSAGNPSSDIIKSTVVAAEDFLRQLNNFYVATTTPVNPPVLPTDIAATTGKGGSDFDADQDSGQSQTTTANNGPSDTAPQVTNSDGVKSANPYSFASQLSGERAQNGGAVGLPSAIEQVLLQMNRGAKSGNDQMTIQLHPAELGTINVKLDFASDGSVSGTVTASNADTLAMLQKDSRSLERALQEAGLRADPGSLQFSLGDPSNSNNSGQTANNSSSGSSSADPTLAGLAALNEDTDIDTTENWIITPSRVNISV